ncbi:hypothetical protein FQZ97_1208080 [compost metagenome]
MDIDVATRQGEGVDVGRIDHGELVLDVAAVTVSGDLLPHFLHIGLQFLVGIARILLGDFLVVAAAEVQLLLLAHHHEVGAPGGRVHCAAGQQERRQQQRQAELRPFHWSTSSIA